MIIVPHILQKEVNFVNNSIGVNKGAVIKTYVTESKRRIFDMNGNIFSEIRSL